MSDRIDSVEFFDDKSRKENEIINIQNVKITDNILFTSVFMDKDIIKDFLENILDIRVDKISFISSEVQMNKISITRGVRFDVYVKNDDIIYDIEIQTSDISDIPKRTRYYQSMIDSNLLDKGDKSFNKLKKSYIIFICLFNPFNSCGTNQCIYKFENLCISDNGSIIHLNDCSYKIFINSKCDEKYLYNNYIKSFIELLNDGYQCITKSTLTNKMIDRMNYLKHNEEWRRKYMDLMNREEYARYEGRLLEAEDTVRNLISMGFDDITISKISNSLSIQQIVKIREDMNYDKV